MAILNQIKTVALLGALTGLLLWIGSFWGQGGVLFALGIAVLLNFFSYFFSDKIVLLMYRAKEAKGSEYKKLHRLVEEVAHKAGIPKPKLYVLPSQAPNAFATGRSPKKACVACTAGIMDLLDEDELKGVLAHEISHIKNRDILIASVVATIAGAISTIAFMARWAALFGGVGGRDSEGRGGRGIELLVLAVLTPIIATLIQLAISRSREYLADESGAKILEDGKPLASALRKLEFSAKHHPLKFGNETTAHLFIVNPFRASVLMSIFSTHPATEERVKRLEGLKF